MLKKISRPLLVLLTFTLLGCHTTTKRYDINPSFQTGDLHASRQYGVSKPGGKPFPLFRSIKDEPNGLGIILYGFGALLGLVTYSTSPGFAIAIALIGPAADLTVTPFRFFYGYEHFDTLEVGGTLQGKLHSVYNNAPVKQPINLIIDSKTIPITLGTDGQFTLPINLQKKSFQGEPIKFAIVFPWRDTLTTTGEALKPTPDTYKYELRLKPNKSIELIDSSGQPVSLLEITPVYEKVTDENRIKEIAEMVAAQKKVLAQKKTERYKREEINKLAESFAKKVVDSTNSHSRPGPRLSGSMMMFNDPTIPNAIERYSWSLSGIKWLNSDKTKAKASVNIEIYFNAGIAATTGNRSGNISDSFKCESDTDGDWRVTEWGRILSQ